MRSSAANIFANGSDLTLIVYLTESEKRVDFNSTEPFWVKDLVYGDWTSGENGDGTYSHEATVTITKHMLNNGSLYVHAFVTRSGQSPDPKHKFYAHDEMSYMRKPINK